jgi:hypothetical protein
MRIADKDKSFLGEFPYSAVALDVKLVPTINSHRDGDFFGFISLISILPDIVIDTLLLPGDIVAWPLGYKKGNLDSIKY